jgi:U3 small nucleolar RNA-associated protein 15
MKVFETTGWNVVSGSKYPSPILSLSVIPSASNEDRHLAVGLQSGILAIRTRLSGQQKVRERERAKEMSALLAGTLEAHDKTVARKQKQKQVVKTAGQLKRLRGRDFKGEGAAIVIHADPRRRAKLRPWEDELRNVRYAAALDLCLKDGESPIEALTLFKTLVHRSALRAALMGRDEVTLQPVLKWLVAKIRKPQYVDMCVEMAILVLELYGTQMGTSPRVDALVARLHEQVREEVENKQMAAMMVGMMGLVVAGSGAVTKVQ